MVELKVGLAAVCNIAISCCHSDEPSKSKMIQWLTDFQ